LLSVFVRATESHEIRQVVHARASGEILPVQDNVVGDSFGSLSDLAIVLLVHVHHEVVDAEVTVDQGAVKEFTVFFC